ncbi:MAG: NB-ARC domain-containing protein [Nostoc sp. DedSLP03]|uniref:NB-ARC domain-containing protein n=1 Tax=Nostoc sp. DedSLP03 TaxID=3075400 RepID=UPI002AD3ACF6|nr:NB-ARC domain-containing protein [Nostoc sp. DedSLP03]MDZ7965812.1 NB-ARC domain-containing protein [Nostoc sp. DedSLP03]
MKVMPEEALAIVESILGQETLNNLQKSVFCLCWEQKSYSEIAEGLDYDDGYIKYIGFQLWKLLSSVLKDKINKNNFREAIIQRQINLANDSLEQLPYISLRQYVNPTSCKKKYFNDSNFQGNSLYQSWGEAIDVSNFNGRTLELDVLSKWINQDYCRLVTILGIDGIGKTALSVKLAEQIQAQFEYVIWRSLRNAPSLDSFLTDLICCFEKQQNSSLCETINQKQSIVLQYLQKHRCLLIIDNVDTILSTADKSEVLYSSHGGCYRDSYEVYGDFFWQVGEVYHNSCLVLTSREKPKEVAILEGEILPVRTLQVTGLTISDVLKIFNTKGNFSGSQKEWEHLIQLYSGNPLTLKVVATTIHDLFNGKVSSFLSRKTVVFGEVKNILERQFNRLSSLEEELIYWISLNRGTVTLADIECELLPFVSSSQLLEALETLDRRCFLGSTTQLILGRNITFLTLQPILVEYVTTTLIQKVCTEIESQNIFILKKYALRKTQAVDHIQEAQIKLILNPIIKKLLDRFEDPDIIKSQLTQILLSLQTQLPTEIGYTSENITNLLDQLSRNT